MKNEVCERWKQYAEGLLELSEERSAEIAARPEMIVRAFEETDHNITR